MVAPFTKRPLLIRKRKNRLAIVQFPLFVIVLFAVASTLANDLDFTLVNQSGRSFEGLYITASDNKDWDANLLLNGNALAAGESIRVRFKNDAKSERWD